MPGLDGENSGVSWPLREQLVWLVQPAARVHPHGSCLHVAESRHDGQIVSRKLQLFYNIERQQAEVRLIREYDIKRYSKIKRIQKIVF